MNDIRYMELATLNETLLDLYEQMMGETDLSKVLLQVTEVVQATLDSERATIYILQEDVQELEAVAVIGNVARKIRIPICSSSLAGFCAQTRQALLVPDAYGDLTSISPSLRFDSSWDLANGFRTRDVMCVPVAFRGDLQGVIQVMNSRGRPFDKRAMTILRIVSRLVSYSLYHARIYDELVSLKALKKQKAQLMRVLVHELKSPAAGAKMLASSLHFVHRDNSQMGPVLGKISSRMDGLLEMIEDILNLSKVQEGGVLSSVEVLDFEREIREACGPYQEQAESKGLAFNLELGERSLPVRFDRQGLRLVVSNLVSNALKYTEQGSVTVKVEPGEDAWAVLSVKDTGMGIPAGDVPKMFQEFFRAANAKKAKIKGTGVGLAGVKEIVERFDGHLELHTEEDRGTEFRVLLKLHEGELGA